MTVILSPAPPWQSERSEYVVLWHGCTAFDKGKIEAGIDLAQCRVDRDFGRGFYTTTLRRQANQWAWKRFYDQKNQQVPGSQPVVLCYRVARAELGRLVSLHFVLDDYDNEDFWSLVQHCRQSVPATQGNPAIIHDHKGPQNGWFDVVSGPVTAFWEQRVAMASADQVGFHTPEAIKILTALMASGNKDAYRWEPVV
jgi:hypothetical protein